MTEEKLLYYTPLSEGGLTRLLLEDAYIRLADSSKVDVAIAGGGPAGLTLAWLLAERGYKVLILEHRLGVGGGMRGGSSLFPSMIVEDGVSRKLLERAGVRLKESSVDGLFLVDPVEATVRLAYKAVDAGVQILVGWHVEDLIVRRDGDSYRVNGLVALLAPIVEAGWHVDPIYFEAKATVDATGHEGRLLRILEKRIPGSIKVTGMSAMNVWEGEEQVIKYTGEVYPGLYVTGMSVAEAYNTFRMGPVFGGMIASANKLADIISRELG